jgi:hypothetical protein
MGSHVRKDYPGRRSLRQLRGKGPAPWGADAETMAGGGWSSPARACPSVGNGSWFPAPCPCHRPTTIGFASASRYGPAESVGAGRWWSAGIIDLHHVAISMRRTPPLPVMITRGAARVTGDILVGGDGSDADDGSARTLGGNRWLRHRCRPPPVRGPPAGCRAFHRTRWTSSSPAVFRLGPRLRRSWTMGSRHGHIHP